MSEVKRRNKQEKSNASRDSLLTPDNNKNIVKPLQQRNISLRVLSRSVVIFSLLIIVYFTANDEKVSIFARQTDTLPGKGQVLECSSNYMQEINKYEDCLAKQCGRFISDKVILAQEAEALLEIAKKGLKFGGSSGGASILDLHSGALSTGEHFINIYKLDQAKGLFTVNDFNVYKVVKEKIKYAVARHFQVDPQKIYLTHPTFFSEITSKKAVTIHDEYWHPHVDKITYKSFHYTTLLYLNDYDKDFKGGRFVFIDEKMNRTVEPKKARLSMFTSGEENLHYVEQVKSGTRYAITISFTCDKNYAIVEPSIKNFL